MVPDRPRPRLKIILSAFEKMLTDEAATANAPTRRRLSGRLGQVKTAGSEGSSFTLSKATRCSLVILSAALRERGLTADLSDLYHVDGFFPVALRLAGI
jgi:hypothetical protein